MGLNSLKLKILKCYKLALVKIRTFSPSKYNFIQTSVGEELFYQIKFNKISLHNYDCLNEQNTDKKECDIVVIHYFDHISKEKKYKLVTKILKNPHSKFVFITPLQNIELEQSINRQKTQDGNKIPWRERIQISCHSYDIGTN